MLTPISRFDISIYNKHQFFLLPVNRLRTIRWNHLWIVSYTHDYKVIFILKGNKRYLNTIIINQLSISKESYDKIRSTP